jgi:hypothetical protein
MLLALLHVCGLIEHVSGTMSRSHLFRGDVPGVFMFQVNSKTIDFFSIASGVFEGKEALFGEPLMSYLHLFT